MAALGVLRRLLLLSPSIPVTSGAHRTFTSVFQSRSWRETPSSLQSAGCGILSRTVPSHWSLLPVRTKKRGMEYQPKFLKRQRTHGWIKRISTRGGIEVILRRMLKGRKSLTFSFCEVYNQKPEAQNSVVIKEVEASVAPFHQQEKEEQRHLKRKKEWEGSK